MMEDFTITIYYFCYNYCKQLEIQQDAKQKLNDSEIIITSIIAARYFSGNLTKEPSYVQGHWGCKQLNKSNFNSNLHRFSSLILSLFCVLGHQ